MLQFVIPPSHILLFADKSSQDSTKEQGEQCYDTRPPGSGGKGPSGMGAKEDQK